ncbi:MAG TPA: hypothetical protein VJ022_06890 [Anaerolineales bacterium]|nr:hypothetical protein [Anaerolineales bacterium]
MSNKNGITSLIVKPASSRILNLVPQLKPLARLGVDSTPQPRGRLL